MGHRPSSFRSLLFVRACASPGWWERAPRVSRARASVFLVWSKEEKGSPTNRAALTSLALSRSLALGASLNSWGRPPPRCGNGGVGGRGGGRAAGVFLLRPHSRSARVVASVLKNPGLSSPSSKTREAKQQARRTGIRTLEGKALEAPEPKVSTRGFLLSEAKKSAFGRGPRGKKTWRLSVGTTTLQSGQAENTTYKLCPRWRGGEP